MGSHHAENVAFRMTNANLYGILDMNLEGAKALGEKLGCEYITDSQEEIANNPDIDSVIIASPARFHAPIAEYFASKGKHVFCEKPAGLA
jgi:Predicted dehydrogenases and related proteins